MYFSISCVWCIKINVSILQYVLVWICLNLIFWKSDSPITISVSMWVDCVWHLTSGCLIWFESNHQSTIKINHQSEVSQSVVACSFLNKKTGEKKNLWNVCKLFCQIISSKLSTWPKQWSEGSVLRPPAKIRRSMCPVTSTPPSPDYPGATTQIAFQERLPNSRGQWPRCLWQKRPFLHWIKFLIEQKNSKNVTTILCNFMWVFTDLAA